MSTMSINFFQSDTQTEFYSIAEEDLFHACYTHSFKQMEEGKANK